VLRAFIRLERHQQTDDFIEYAPGVVGCMGAFQMAVALWKVGAVSAAGIGRVASELVGRGIKADALALRLYDLCRRAIVTPEEAREVAARLRHHDLVPELGEFPEPDPRWSAALQRDPSRVWTPRQYLGE
jgi:hypothetical protein